MIVWPSSASTSYDTRVSRSSSIDHEWEPPEESSTSPVLAEAGVNRTIEMRRADAITGRIFLTVQYTPYLLWSRLIIKVSMIHVWTGTDGLTDVYPHVGAGLT